MHDELSDRVVREDRRLEDTAERSRAELAKHRWHWTLDESNPNRVGVRAYARAIGRHWTTVNDMVNGYATWLAEQQKEGVGGTPYTAPSLVEAMALAKMRGETATAAKAIAKAKGIDVESVRRHHAGEIRSVKAAAEERVERSKTPTTFDAEAERVAAGRVQGATTRKKKKAESKRRRTFRYVEVEGRIATMRREGLAALEVMQDVSFGDEERELLAAAVADLLAILKLIDLRLDVDASVDWDAEMRKLGSA
jgi:hypothetical protein